MAKMSEQSESSMKNQNHLIEVTKPLEVFNLILNFNKFTLGWMA